MPAVPSLVLYRKVVNWGLTPQAINFAQSSFMGHRVCFNVPVDFMNEYFTWTRYSGELRPTGRFVNSPSALANIPTFERMLERCLGAPYTDLDGVATALNYSSDALDTSDDVKRDQCVDNYTWDYTGLGASPQTAVVSAPTGKHYGANDLVMAFVLNKCFGASAFDAYDIVYNLEDAFGMLTSAQLAAAITASMQEEEALAAAAVLPAKEVSNQLPGDNKGLVDEMFRALLSIDPQRFYKNGKQIKGLFETNYVCSGAVFKGTIAGSTLTVLSVTSGRLSLGAVLTTDLVNGVEAGLIITAMAPGTIGGAGSYTLSKAITTAITASTNMTIDQDIQGLQGSVTKSGSDYTLNVTTTLTGAVVIADGSAINGPGLPRGTTVTAILPTAPATVVSQYILVLPAVQGINDGQILGANHYFTVPTPDPDANGNWCLAVGDKIEVPIKLYFRAPVTVLSVVDGAKNPSSATPDQVETVFIKGENGAAFDSSNADNVAAADRGNVMAVRLQIVCSAPAISPPSTRSSAEDHAALLQVVNQSSLIFYKGKHYPIQTAIGVVAAGGVGPYTYAFTPSGTYDVVAAMAGLTGPPGVTISSSGLFTFDPTGVAAAAGRWKVNLTITDSAATPASVTTDIYISVEDSLGNTNGPAPTGPPSGLTMHAPTSTNGITITATGSSYTMAYTAIVDYDGDVINFNPNSDPGTWSALGYIGGNSTNIINFSSTQAANTVWMNATTGVLHLDINDAQFPPGSQINVTVTRTYLGASGITVLSFSIPLTELVFDDTYVTGGNSAMSSYYVSMGVEPVTGYPLRTYTITDSATNGPYTFKISAMPNNPNYAIVVVGNSNTVPNGSFALLGNTGAEGIFTYTNNSNWHSNAGITAGYFYLDYQEVSTGTSILANPIHIHFNLNDY